MEVTHEVEIPAPRTRVWQILTDPELSHEWLSDSGLRAHSTWELGGPYSLQGDWHGKPFESHGKILAWGPPSRFGYELYSSLSRNLDVIELSLEQDTVLRVRQSNIPHMPAFHHVQFYWRMALGRIAYLAQR